MQFLTVTMMLGGLVTLFGSATCATLPVALASRSAIDRTTNATRTPAKWVGMSKGKNVTLYGEASSIMAQLKELDEDWVPNRLPSTPGNSVTTVNNATAMPGSLDARAVTVSLTPQIKSYIPSLY